MQPPPTLKNTEKNRCGTKKTAERKREPPKKKKVCWREEEETATERERLPKGKREPQKKNESLLAGRRGNSNGTKKATGEKKENRRRKRKFAGGKRRKQQRDKKGHRRKKENRRKTRKPAGGKAEPSWAAKRVQKKREETRFPTVKKNKNGPFGDLSERESFIIFMPFYRNRSDMAQTFDIFLIVMALLALVVFAALHFFEAGYGYLFNPKYGPPVPNKIGWVLMESPVFVAMCVLWLLSERTWEAGPLTLFALFQAHYLQRAFIFPLLMRGASKMPLGIVVMGMCFNTLNALMQGGWIFYVSPEGYYADWFAQPYIYIGGAMFLAGMAVNLHSDHIIRNLRRPGDTRHYIPRGGMFRYVSSANYFGELLEWTGFAVASWSWAGAVFAWWTFANLAPRAASLNKRYAKEFGDEFTSLGCKKIIPFIY